MINDATVDSICTGSLKSVWVRPEFSSVVILNRQVKCVYLRISVISEFCCADYSCIFCRHLSYKLYVWAENGPYDRHTYVYEINMHTCEYYLMQIVVDIII